MVEHSIPEQSVLIVCRELDQVALLSRIRLESHTRYAIASDDIRVQRIAREYPWVGDVCWIERMESFYPVSSDVLRILGVINCWLESLGDTRRGIPAELLFWPQHVEGGMTTQRIQDALLLVRSYIGLFESFDIGRVILLRNSNTAWEDEVLVQTARGRGISVQEIGRFQCQIEVVLQQARTYFRYAMKALQGVRRVVRIGGKLRRVSEASRETENAQTRGEIVFQLCSSERKHVENVVPLMKALRERGYRSLALTWRAAQGAESVRQQELDAEELEKYIPVTTYLKAFYRLAQTLLKAKGKMRDLLDHPEFWYESVPLANLLQPSVAYFLHAELGVRYLFRQAIRQYLEQHNVLAIKLWGGTTLAEGSITYQNLHPARKPLTLEYWLGPQLDSPYDQGHVPSDLYLATGLIQREVMQRIGIPPVRIAMIGQVRYDKLCECMMTYSPDASRSMLNLPLRFGSYIFFDPNASMRGYLTTQEQILVTDTLLKFTQDHPAVALVIKPHPTHQPGMLEQVVQSAALPNAYLVDKSMLPYHALNAADVVITKYSTIGLEGMLLDRPVISVLLDNEKRWQSVYEDAVEYVTTLSALTELLTRLTDDAYRFQWTETRLEKQRDFLQRYFTQNEQSTALLAADAIVSRIRVDGHVSR